MNENKPLEEVWQWKDNLAKKGSNLTLKQIVEQITKNGKKISAKLQLNRVEIKNLTKIK